MNRAPEDLHQIMNNLKELGSGYISLQKRLAKLSLIQFLAKAGGTVMDGVISFILVCILVVFAGISGALWLSHRTGSYLSGFAWTTGILFAIAILIHLLRKPLFINPLIHRLVRKLHADIEEIKKQENDAANPY